MLEVLFGNKTVVRVLLFLFVNGKCYGTQLQRQLKTALTPIQKTLQRLEKGGLLASYYEGKTRLYQFNAAYPVLEELELLLKKAYTLLPPQKKKEFYVNEPALLPRGRKEHRMELVSSFWERLGSVRRLAFVAKSKMPDEKGWNGRGRGEVTVTKESATVITFAEKGVFVPKHGGEVDFSNVFRWTLDRTSGVVALEHLRHGVANPVFLFHLAPTGAKTLSSVDSHLCGGDVYLGQARLDDHALRLSWRVIGPKKNEEIIYHYN